MFTVNRNPSRGEVRKFGWAMLIGFGVIGGLLWVVPFLRPWGVWDTAELGWSGSRGQVTALAFWCLGLLLWAVALAAPGGAGRTAYVLWMSVTMPIGIAVSTVMLSVLYFVLLPVFSVIVRYNDPLRRKIEPERETYWEDYKPYEASIERMRRPF